jgi:glutamyl/glutaminyl-tRNA synthetase
LLPEFSLYQHYCWQFCLPEPEHIYLPRLQGPRGDISKTASGSTLAELRAEGYTPGQVRDMLARACLLHAPNGWTLDNLRAEPRR